MKKKKFIVLEAFFVSSALPLSKYKPNIAWKARWMMSGVEALKWRSTGNLTALSRRSET